MSIPGGADQPLEAVLQVRHRLAWRTDGAARVAPVAALYGYLYGTSGSA